MANDFVDKFIEQTDQKDVDPALYPSMLAALESKPSPVIPADFTARMMTMAKAQPMKRRRTRTHYGQAAAWVSLFVVTAVVIAMAPSTIAVDGLGTSPRVMLEYVLLAQMLGLALWLGTRAFPGTR